MKNVTQYTGWNQIAEFHKCHLLPQGMEYALRTRTVFTCGGNVEFKSKSEKCIDVGYTGQARSQYMTRKVDEVDNA